MANQAEAAEIVERKKLQDALNRVQVLELERQDILDLMDDTYKLYIAECDLDTQMEKFRDYLNSHGRLTEGPG